MIGVNTIKIAAPRVATLRTTSGTSSSWANLGQTGFSRPDLKGGSVLMFWYYGSGDVRLCCYARVRTKSGVIEWRLIQVVRLHELRLRHL
jgi:hypothetical protein